MRSYELRIEEIESAGIQAGDKVDQRDFGSIACGVKHAFSKKCAAKCQSIEAADKGSLFVDFYGMDIAEIKKLTEEFTDPAINPC